MDVAGPKATDAEVETNTTKLTSVLSDSKSNSVIIFFAHWCPHCKSVISKLSEMKGLPFSVVLVNGEAIGNLSEQGIDIQYYPTILCKKGDNGQQVESLDAARAYLTAEEAAASAKQTSLSPPSEFLNGLF